MCFFLSEVRTIQIHKTMTSENYHWTGDTDTFVFVFVVVAVVVVVGISSRR